MVVTNETSLAEKAHYLTTQAKDDPLHYRSLFENVNEIALTVVLPENQSNYWFYSLLLNNEVYGLAKD